MAKKVLANYSWVLAIVVVAIILLLIVEKCWSSPSNAGEIRAVIEELERRKEYLA